jgi:fused signal recognition particle receptor
MNFLKSLVHKFTGRPVDWEELEALLIRADLGVPMTLRIMEALRTRAERTTITPKVLLIVGVNGTGKTTSTAKLAQYFKRNQHSVMLAAADTFRAAAIEQLGVWAERTGVEMIRGQYNADPASLCYEAYAAADRKNIEFLICDTAGRLHTKSNLMAELSKVKRSLAKQNEKAPDETLLVVDATTGSNALNQAREFHQAIGLTGLIVTKLDGSGKGGIVIAIQDELGIPTRFVGTGEKLEDIAAFDGRDFIANMV